MLNFDKRHEKLGHHNNFIALISIQKLWCNNEKVNGTLRDAYSGVVENLITFISEYIQTIHASAKRVISYSAQAQPFLIFMNLHKGTC